MRRTLVTTLMVIIAVGLFATASLASTQKFTFSDVTLATGEAGEIEASVKLHKNKDDSVYCGYFSDDYAESLGYYFDFYEAAPTGPEAVLATCIEKFDERNTQ